MVSELNAVKSIAISNHLITEHHLNLCHCTQYINGTDILQLLASHCERADSPHGDISLRIVDTADVECEIIQVATRTGSVYKKHYLVLRTDSKVECTYIACDTVAVHIGRITPEHDIRGLTHKRIIAIPVEQDS